jgi:hypothetical protein
MKKILIIGGIILLLLAALYYQHHRLTGFRAENQILNTNIEVLTGEADRYRVRDSLNVVSARELSLKLADYERYRAEDARLIGELRADKKRIESVVAVQQQTIRELQLPIEPVVVVKENLTTDTIRQIAYSDRWLEFRAWEDSPDSMRVQIISRDSLLIVEHIIPRRFLGFLWKTRRAKERRIEALPKSPYTEIIDTEFVTIRE